MLSIASAAYAGGHNDAGCGIGSLIFKDNTKVQQSLVYTIHYFLPQSSSITSGTSGCSPDGNSAMRRKEREVFVAVNFRSLSKELAMGSGEFASSFASLMGCSEESVPAFLQETKESYSEIFSKDGTTPKEMLNRIESTVTSDQDLSQVCVL